jgi:tetratricopeptide (TPR) repeat protein
LLVLFQSSKNTILKFAYKFYAQGLYFLVLCILLSCSSQKDGKKLHLMKNVTAHYNIYFNARERLRESQLKIRSAYDDDYNQLLELFPIPDEQSSSNESENLNQVIQKSNTIALEKYESNWLDDAYLLLADAEYLKGDFYNAVEYYSYVGITFPKEKKNKLLAYLGEIKSDIALEKYNSADSLMQMAVNLRYKYSKDEVAALQAKLALEKRDIKSAIKNLSKAIDFSKDKYQKIRWRYILAQLQELDNQTDDAYVNYSKIVKSNAAFEMSFNANLSRIRISESKEGKQFDKIATLTRLLKEDKNREFKEQIYYQIAIAYHEQKDFNKSIEFYQRSAHTVPGTVKQKGLSFLKLAQLNFEDLKNYTQAQLYYDSTLQYLPKTYPDYKNIAIKANNLQYLADRLIIIEENKKSLKLASLTNKEIDTKFEKIFNAQKERLINNQQQSLVNPQALTSISSFSSSNKNSGNFYFDNSAALSQGFDEFKRKWGNRKLADNWRTSANAANNENKAASTNLISNNGINADLKTLEEKKDSLKAEFISKIPYSPAAKDIGYANIANALNEIAVFYKDVLKDNSKAIETFQNLVENYPNYIDAANINYQLYRLFQPIDIQKANEYKDQLIKKYPNSIYAKTLNDPKFGKEQELFKAQINDNYKFLYQMYQERKYNGVLDSMNILRKHYSSFGDMSSQYAYLEALAIGNTQKVPAFLVSLDGIIKTYPDDNQITPRVKQEIDFIAKNRTAFDQRPTALISYDANAPSIDGNVTLIIPKVEEPKLVIKEEPKKEVTADFKKEEIKAEPIKPAIITPKVEEPKKEIIAEIKKGEVKSEPKKPSGISFSEDLSQKHVIIFDFTDPKQNISPAFSSLSQYFYKNYDPTTVKLLIRGVGTTDKFIIISNNFYSKKEAVIVLDALNEQLSKIMEGQSNDYFKFVVSESNLQLLTTREAVDQYLKFSSEKK